MMPAPSGTPTSSSHKIKIVRHSTTPSTGTSSPAPAGSTPSLKIKLNHKRPRIEDPSGSVSGSGSASTSSTPTRRPSLQPDAYYPTSLDSPVKRRKRTPIKEALTRLIQQLIKRDAYAIFTQPVDEREVPGYRTVIQHPMDLGTMQAKVADDAYARIDQFKFDLLLVTGNAKVFNLPDSFYSQQAQKLEDWGLKAIEAAQAKGIRQHGDEPSPEPAESAPRPALTPIPNAGAAGSSNGNPVKRLSIKLKRPPSMGGGAAGAPVEHRKTKKNGIHKKRKDKTKSPSVSRPLVSSSLSRPPMLADSPSPASSDDEGDDSSARPGGDDSDDDNDEQASSESGSGQDSGDDDSSDGSDEDERDATRSHYATSRPVKHEYGSDQDMAEDEDDEDEDEDDEDDDDPRIRIRNGSMSRDTRDSFRDSETPIPGVGGSTRKRPLQYATKPRLQQKRNAPSKPEEAVSVAIKKILDDAKAKGIHMTVHDAALDYRQNRRNQSSRVFAYALDGSLDLEQCKANERHDLFDALGFFADEATGAPVTDAGMPELLATYPLHPDAQKHLDKLTRVAPSDSLGVAINADVRPKETTGSHYEHALPLNHRRPPTSVPTAYASFPGPTRPDGGFVPGEGVVQKTPSDVPYAWPHPTRSAAKDYEPPAQMDPFYPASSEDPAASRPKYRNKDFERENEGQATLRDWTYPHVSYSRLWDGSGDLAVWKDLDTAIRSAGFGAGEQHQRWEETRALRMREMVNAEEKQAVAMCSEQAIAADERERAKRTQTLPSAQSRGKSLPDDESELGLLNKLLQLDEEMAAGGSAMKGTSRKMYANLLPAERMRHTINGAEYLTRELWGQPTIPGIRPGHIGLTPIPVPGGVADGEMWARSVQSFIEGAVDGLEDDEESSDEEQGNGGVHANGGSASLPALAPTQEDVKPRVNDEERKASPGGLFADERSPASESSPPPRPRTSSELLLDAYVQGMVLDRPLYEYVRDEIVAAQTHFRSLTTVALLGEKLQEFEAREVREQSADNESQSGAAQSDIDDVAMKELDSLLSETSSGPGTPAPVLSHPATQSVTPDSAAWVLLRLPLLWSSGSYLKRLLEAPMHIDTEHLMLKREDWMQPEVPVEYSKGGGSPAWPMRMEEREWTGPRIAAALEQYGQILLGLDAKVRAQNGQLDEASLRMKNFVRLALLAIARLAPGFSIKVSRR